MDKREHNNDDTQSVIIEDKKVEAVETAKREANNVIDFFENNNLVNNADKAAILYNSGGKGDSITVKGIGGESISSLNPKNYWDSISIQALSGILT